jgi:hypothetical protein
MVTELYDVVGLPDVVRPMALGFKTDEIQRVLREGAKGRSLTQAADSSAPARDSRSVFHALSPTAILFKTSERPTSGSDFISLENVRHPAAIPHWIMTRFWLSDQHSIFFGGFLRQAGH